MYQQGQPQAVVNGDSMKHFGAAGHIVDQGQYSGLYQSAGLNAGVSNTLLQVQQQQLQAGLQGSNGVPGSLNMSGAMGINVSLPAVTAPQGMTLPPGFPYPPDLWRQAMFPGALLPPGLPAPDLNSLSAASAAAAAAATHAAPLTISKSVDETELKKLRRKQSNRESARRSRLRKQAETQEMSKQVDGLSNTNTELRRQLMTLNEMAEKLSAQNTTLQEYLQVLKAKAGIPDASGRPPVSMPTKLEAAAIKDILTSDPAKEYQMLVAKFQETPSKALVTPPFQTQHTTTDDDDCSDDDDGSDDGSDDSMGNDSGNDQRAGGGSTGAHMVPAGAHYSGEGAANCRNKISDAVSPTPPTSVATVPAGLEPSSPVLVPSMVSVSAVGSNRKPTTYGVPILEVCATVRSPFAAADSSALNRKAGVGMYLDNKR